VAPARLPPTQFIFQWRCFSDGLQTAAGKFSAEPVFFATVVPPSLRMRLTVFSFPDLFPSNCSGGTLTNRLDLIPPVFLSCRWCVANLLFADFTGYPGKTKSRVSFNNRWLEIAAFPLPTPIVPFEVVVPSSPPFRFASGTSLEVSLTLDSFWSSRVSLFPWLVRLPFLVFLMRSP